MESSRRRAALALALSVPVPSLGVLAATSWCPGQRGALLWSAAKLWFFAFPALWFLIVERGRASFTRPARSSWLAGLALGLALALAIALCWFTFARDWIEPERLRALAKRNGIARPAAYLALALYLALANSLLEEYAWRWFAVREFERLVPRGAARVCAAASFTAHHALLLQAQLGTRAALAGSLGVFAAGFAWSWLYQRTRSVWPVWLSHVLADLVLLGLGWSLIKGS